jgi:hypothetical protein
MKIGEWMRKLQNTLFAKYAISCIFAIELILCCIIIIQNNSSQSIKITVPMIIGSGFGILCTLSTCHKIPTIKKWQTIVLTLSIISILFYTISLIIMRMMMGKPSRECFISYDIGLTFISMDLVSLLCIAFLTYQYFK